MANTEQALNKAREALETMRNLGVSLNDHDSAALDTLCDFAESTITAASTEAATPDELRRAVRVMTESLNNREWAEHVSNDEDAQALELAITELVGKTAPQASQPIGQPSNAVRYCFECGSIGEVDRTKYLGCCPDNRNDYVRKEIAEQARFGFKAKLNAGHPSNGWSEWVRWDGGVCPLVPFTKFQIMGRSGGVEDGSEDPSEWGWEHRGSGGDVVAFRLAASNSQPVSGAMTDDDIADIAESMEATDPTDKFWLEFARKIEAHILSASGQAVSEKAVRDADSVKNILLRVVPGDDGIGKEIYANSIADVEEVLTEMGERLETLESENSKLRALSSTPAQQTEAPVNVPSGWKLVPHEPTAEMRNEGADMMWDRKGTSVDVWQAMWNAAPAPVQTEAQQSEKDAERAIKDQIRAAYDDGYNHGKANGNSGCSRYVGGKVEAERGNRVIAAIAKEKAKS